MKKTHFIGAALAAFAAVPLLVSAQTYGGYNPYAAEQYYGQSQYQSGYSTYPSNQNSFTATPMSGQAPLAVRLTATGLSSSGSYSVNFGDGTSRQGSCSITPTSVCTQGTLYFTHTYAIAGAYTATLIKQGGTCTVNGVPTFCGSPDQQIAAATITVTGGNREMHWCNGQWQYQPCSQDYQYYWCNGYYSYSPCWDYQQYYYYPYQYYYYPYYYDYGDYYGGYDYGYGYNYNYNYNYSW